MSSIHEARFRLQSSDSQLRTIKVIALDGPSNILLRQLSKLQWGQATFLSASRFVPTHGTELDHCPDGWLLDMNGEPKDLNNEMGAADLVIMIVMAGGNAHAARLIGGACGLRRVNTAAFISVANLASDESISKTLTQLRPWSLMTVIAESNDYIEDMLVALRA
jgi:hypothetical protein